MNDRNHSIHAMMGLIALFIIGCAFSVISFDHVFLLRSISSFYYISLSLSLILYFANSIPAGRTKKYLIWIGAMILLWFLIRIEKYCSFSESEYMIRMLWYAYYIPMLVIPQLSFMVTLSVGKTENEKLPTIQYITAAITAVCVALVLTNDLHQMVFRFPEGIEKGNYIYTHEKFFWVVVLWAYVFLAISVCAMLVKCRLSNARRNAWIPFVYSLIFIFWSVITFLDIRPQIMGSSFGEFPETVCFMMGGIWVLCISIGLIPSNHGYKRIFAVTTIASLIADKNYETVYKSVPCTEMTRTEKRGSYPLKISEDILAYRKEIPGGYAYWQTDVSELNNINRELSDAADTLSAEKEILLLEKELKKNRLEIDTRSKLYDDIAVRVYHQSERIEALVEDVKKNMNLFEEHMREISMHMVYIKRMSNLMLLASGKSEIDRGELQLAVLESLRYLSKAGKVTQSYADETNISLDTRYALCAYELFQMLIESSFSDMYAISVNFNEKTIKIVVEGASMISLWAPGCIKLTMETDEDVSFICIEPAEEGII